MDQLDWQCRRSPFLRSWYEMIVTILENCRGIFVIWSGQKNRRISKGNYYRVNISHQEERRHEMTHRISVTGKLDYPFLRIIEEISYHMPIFFWFLTDPWGVYSIIDESSLHTSQESRAKDRLVEINISRKVQWLSSRSFRIEGKRDSWIKSTETWIIFSV